MHLLPFAPRDNPLQCNSIGNFLQLTRVLFGYLVRRKSGRRLRKQGCKKDTNRKVGAILAGVPVVLSPQIIGQVLDSVCKGAVDIGASNAQLLGNLGKQLVKRAALRNRISAKRFASSFTTMVVWVSDPLGDWVSASTSSQGSDVLSFANTPRGRTATVIISASNIAKTFWKIFINKTSLASDSAPRLGAVLRTGKSRKM